MYTSLYLATTTNIETLTSIAKNKICLVVGVKDSGSDLDAFLETYPQVKVIHRFKDTCNNRYVFVEGYKERHMLQTAYITL